MAYLAYRDPLPVYSNPGIALPPQHFANSEVKWLQYAAKFVDAAIDYKCRLDSGTIPIEMSGKFPMDMQQYYKLFGSTRISGSPKDIQQIIPTSTHAIVVHNGNVSKYRVQSVNPDTQILYIIQMNIEAR